MWIHCNYNIKNNLDKFWIQIKVTNSNGKGKGEGRLDPEIIQDLFTEDTKVAIDKAILMSDNITNKLSRDDLYEASAPPIGSKGQFTIWKSNRGVKSILEKVHHSLAHFVNQNMRQKLADALTKSGIAIIFLPY